MLLIFLILYAQQISTSTPTIKYLDEQIKEVRNAVFELHKKTNNLFFELKRIDSEVEILKEQISKLEMNKLEEKSQNNKNIENLKATQLSPELQQIKEKLSTLEKEIDSLKMKEKKIEITTRNQEKKENKLKNLISNPYFNILTFTIAVFSLLVALF